MLDYVWQQYEVYKQKLIAYIASFFALGDKIQEQMQRAQQVYAKAQRSGNPALIAAARDVVAQTAQLYQDQQSTQQQVLDAKDKIDQVDSAAADDSSSGLGFLPIAAIAAAVAVIVAAISAVVIIFQKYDYLNRTLDDLEQKTLSPSEYATATGAIGSSLFSGIGGMVLLGAAAFVGYKLLLARKG